MQLLQYTGFAVDLLLGSMSEVSGSYICGMCSTELCMHSVLMHNVCPLLCNTVNMMCPPCAACLLVIRLCSIVYPCWRVAWV
jgi:hypothetical protein